MILTPQQLQAIQKIIQEYHDAFIASAISPKAIAPEMLAKLKKKGLVKTTISSIEEAYIYGQLLAALENPKVAKMSYPEFKAYVKAHPVPLTPMERTAMQIAVLSAGQYCKGLGNRVNQQTGNILIEADKALRAKMMGAIQTTVAENIQRRESVSQLKSALGWKTKDWTRDLMRIAVTEKQSAMLQGQADQYAKKHGKGVLVAKRPMPDCCPKCEKLYIGPDGQPRIFPLDVLTANGTNVGKKQADWLPTVGPVHPNCQCVMSRVPAGWGFNDEGQLVPGGTLGVRYESAEDMEEAMHEEASLQKSYEFDRDILFQGIPVVIENHVGSIRRWTAADGGKGETRMLHAYGYIPGTTGADADEMDVFLGPDPRAEMVYVITQQNPQTGLYDEEKCMLGFSNQNDAEISYRLHYDCPDDYMLDIVAMELEQFQRWISGTRSVPALLKTWDLRKAGNLEEARPRFVIPVEVEFQKAAGPFIGPRGGKWADAEHTISWKDAEDIGGTVHQHTGDPDKVMVKVPPHKIAHLAALKQKHNIAEPIQAGKNHVMLAVPKSVLQGTQKEAPKSAPVAETPQATGKPPYAKTPWTEPKSVEEAKAWCKGVGIDADFPDLPTAVEVTQLLSEQHPMALAHVQFIGTPQQLAAWAKQHPEMEKLSKEGKHSASLQHFTLGGNATAIAHPLGSKPYLKSVVVIRPEYYHQGKAAHNAKPTIGEFTVGDNTGDVLRHELGHVEAFVMRHLMAPSGKSMWEIWKKHAVGALKSNPKQVMKDVSQYSAKDPHELWSEISVLRRKGVKLPEWVNKATAEMGIDSKEWKSQLAAGHPWSKL